MSSNSSDNEETSGFDDQSLKSPGLKINASGIKTAGLKTEGLGSQEQFDIALLDQLDRNNSRLDI
jgi:hypothetical protein